MVSRQTEGSTEATAKLKLGVDDSCTLFCILADDWSEPEVSMLLQIKPSTQSVLSTSEHNVSTYVIKTFT